MGKSSGLAVFALLVALGALGLGIYQLIFATGPAGPPGADGVDGIDAITNTWYDYVDSDGIGSSGEGIAGLFLTINLTSDEYLYISFTCTFECDGLIAEIRILIDDAVTNGYAKETRDSNAGWEWFSMAIQHVNNTLAAGTHTISVWARGSDPSNYVTNCVLFVQTIQI